MRARHTDVDTQYGGLTMSQLYPWNRTDVLVLAINVGIC